MGPEEIHIFFWEGAPRPPKSKCDRPKNLEVFFSQFSNFSCLGVEAVITCPPPTQIELNG